MPAATSQLAFLAKSRDIEQKAALELIQKAGLRKKKEYLEAQEISAIAEKVSGIDELVRDALKALPHDRGAGGKPGGVSLAHGARDVFQAAGGVGTYTADATRFISQFCKLAGYRVQSPEALKQLLKASGKKVSGKGTT